MNHCHQYLDSFLVDIVIESQHMFKVVVKTQRSGKVVVKVVVLSILLTLQRYVSLELRINEVFRGLFRCLSKLYGGVFCENN